MWAGSKGKCTTCMSRSPSLADILLGTAKFASPWQPLKDSGSGHSSRLGGSTEPSLEDSLVVLDRSLGGYVHVRSVIAYRVLWSWSIWISFGNLWTSTLQPTTSHFIHPVPRYILAFFCRSHFRKGPMGGEKLLRLGVSSFLLASPLGWLGRLVWYVEL